MPRVSCSCLPNAFSCSCGECDEDPRFKLPPASKHRNRSNVGCEIRFSNRASMIADARVRPWRLDSLFFRRDGVVLQLNSVSSLKQTVGNERSEEHTSELQSLMRHSYAVL